MATNMRNNYAQYDGRSAEERALERYAELVIEKLKDIDRDRKEPWFRGGTLKWPKSLAGRDFNGMNALMLLLHCEKEWYHVPVFMTFERVMELNKDKNNIPLKDREGNALPRVAVLKGAKSFPVFFTTYTVIHDETKAKINYDDYKRLSNGEQGEYKVYPKQQVYNVFNVDQTNIQETRPELYDKLREENRTLPPELTADVYNFPAIDEMLMNNEWICPIYLRHKHEAYYSPTRNEIVLPGKEHFDDGESFYGAVLQEMMHSTGGDVFLNRFDPNHTFWGAPEYKGEDLAAELGSALVMQKYGFFKTIKPESYAYVKKWLGGLEKSPEFLKSILTAVKSSTAMVNEKIEGINRRLMDECSDMRKNEVLYVTEMPEKVVAEFRMSDKESCDAVYKLLLRDFFDKDTGKPIEICRPSDKIVRLDSKYDDEALDYVYNCLDSESLSKLVASGNYFNGYPIENYSGYFNKCFTTEFEKKRNDPAWLKEQGLSGDIVWDLRFISDDGYHLVKATSGDKSKLGALDYNCNVFLPFTDIGENVNIETDLGYMTEFRRRLLYQNGKVDAFGRISFAGPTVRDTNSGVASRELLIDGEAKATFVLKPDDYMYDLNFVLDLDKSTSKEFDADDKTNSLKYWFGDISYNKKSDTFQVAAKGIRNLLIAKDKFYPIRIINEKVNMPLIDYCMSKDIVEHEKREKENIKERVEVHPGLFAVKNGEGMWGLSDSNERIVMPCRWVDFEIEEDGKAAFCAFMTRHGVEVSEALRMFDKKELTEMSEVLPRISDVRVEQRGKGEDRWVTANIDGRQALSEKITKRDWIEYQGAWLSALQLGMKYYSDILAQKPEMEMKSGMRM